MNRALTAILILGFSLDVMAIHCPSAIANIEKMQKELNALLKLRDEMNKEFEGVLTKDFQSMAEGEKASPERGTAVKLAFAKNRLNKKIEAKEKEQSDLNKDFCKFCGPDKKDAAKIAKFCEYCEDRTRCSADQP